MTTITAFEAKTRFGELLERVEKGEEIVITKYRRPVARIVPEKKRDLTKVREAVRGLRELREEMRRKGFKPLTYEEIKSSIEEGRR